MKITLASKLRPNDWQTLIKTINDLESQLNNWFGQPDLPVVVTAKLPPAAFARHGLILVEDAGDGVKNLIVYANGEMHRFTGTLDSGGFLTPDLLIEDFEDNSYVPLINDTGINLDIVTDPTVGSVFGGGKVGRLHYPRVGAPGPNEDVDTAWRFQYPRGLGEPIYIAMDFYVDVADLTNAGANNKIRKLFYFQARHDPVKYPHGPNGTSNRTVVGIDGDGTLYWDSNWSPGIGNTEGPGGTSFTDSDTRVREVIHSPINGKQKYHIEIFQQMETAFGTYNGKGKVWLDGVNIFDRSDLRWTDPLWVGADGDQDFTWGPTVPLGGMQAGDIIFENFLIGQQVTSPVAFDEYRYVDNIEISTTRIG